ncbi:phytanoyl-CoA dioxygenase PhyH [Trinickia symbiotica]|uniref:Phytanoyl-CoA dioxygenase n=1 Tax=Trinickia symbiotica TaxID=863227 RepID=A0A2N7X7R9_9BURK|nr:phytanoyl-CoA dioxygenase family protein [Trinickia symbiotica]PMS37505.1 phytanoyl-CoA dioxygenase [Trinickia symbiotica]PPK44091.1 phytanoyl-CoA dioxygenase PhyH [Trinickia symbiotica]
MSTVHSTHGVAMRLNEADLIDERLAELMVNGYTILDSGMPDAALVDLRARLDSVYSAQCVEMDGEDVLRSMHDTDVARCVVAYDAAFLQLATNNNLMQLARRLFGSDFILMQQNGILNRPDRDNYQAKWHRDLSYQHWVSTKPLAINALFCVDEFTNDNGATFVLPATHHVEAFPTNAFVSKFELQLTAPAGSYLILDAMLFHRAGINRSASVRRAVNHLIGLPFMAQQIDIPRAIASAQKIDVVDETTRKYLGYRWSPAADAVEWRRRRLPK